LTTALITYANVTHVFLTVSNGNRDFIHSSLQGDSHYHAVR